MLKINFFNWTLNESHDIHCDYAVILFILLILMRHKDERETKTFVVYVLYCEYIFATSGL